MPGTCLFSSKAKPEKYISKFEHDKLIHYYHSYRICINRHYEKRGVDYSVEICIENETYWKR